MRRPVARPLIAGADDVLSEILSRPQQVPWGLLFRIGDADRRELARAEETEERPGVSMVGLHAPAGAAWGERGRDDDAVDAKLRELALPAVPGGPGLVADAERISVGEAPAWMSSRSRMPARGAIKRFTGVERAARGPVK